jgi:hypothetical protein
VPCGAAFIVVKAGSVVTQVWSDTSWVDSAKDISFVIT